MQNVIKVDEVGVIRVSGMDNKITYRGDPEPKIIQTGMGNDIGRALLGPVRPSPDRYRPYRIRSSGENEGDRRDRA